MNKCTFLIRLVADPDLKFIPGSGTAVASFTGAVDKGLSRDKKTEYESQGKSTSDFPRFKAFGKTAENISQYFSKGSLVLIESRLQTGSYENDKGDKVYTNDFIVDRFYFVESGKKTENKSDDDFSFGAGSFEDFQDINEDSIPF